MLSTLTEIKVLTNDTATANFPVKMKGQSWVPSTGQFLPYTLKPAVLFCPIQKYRPRRVVREVKKQQERGGIRRKARDLLDEFLESSSIHGLNHLARKDRNFSEHIFWIIILTAAITGTFYIGQQSWRRYQYFPTVIYMEKDYKNWNTTFAMATVCPKIKVEESALKKIAERFKVQDLNGFLKFFNVLAGASYENFNFLPNYHEIQPNNYLEIVVQAKYNFSFRKSNSQDIDQELPLMITETGLCYGINAEVGLYFSIENFNKKLSIRRRNNNLIHGSPLDGEVFIQVMNMNSGYNVSLTGPYDLPDVSVRRFTSDLRYYLLLELTALSMISSDNIRTLNPLQRKCRFYDESDLEISDIYAYNICRMQCRANLAYKFCKCIPYFYRKSKGKPYCNVTGLKCLGKYHRHLIYLREPFTNKRVPCGCLPLCNDVHYLIELETVLEWSKATNLKFSMVHYPRTRLKREIIFGFADLLVSVGGAAGLFLGCSVLSFIEIIYYLTLRVFFFIKTTLNKNDNLVKAVNK